MWEYFYSLEVLVLVANTKEVNMACSLGEFKISFHHGLHILNFSLWTGGVIIEGVLRGPRTWVNF